MDLTPELLLEAKFAPARRGYDMNEVDDFLERCAEGLDVLLARLRAEFDRAERAEAAVAELQAARGGPAPVGRSTPPEEVATGAEPSAAVDADPTSAAEPVETPATADAEPSVEEPMRILIAAERTAEAAIAEARAQAERIRSEAEAVASTQRSEAEALLARSRSEAEAEARRAGEEARRTIESEVLSLRRDRDALTHDVSTLRHWLDEQRARLRTTARDLQRLVDDPAALRELPVPELREDATAGANGNGDANGNGTVAATREADADEPDAGAHDPVDAADDPVDAADDPVDTADDPVGATEGGLTIFDDEDDGEPTEAVPAVEGFGVFDDDDDRDTASAGRNARGR